MPQIALVCYAAIPKGKLYYGLIIMLIEYAHNNN